MGIGPDYIFRPLPVCTRRTNLFGNPFVDYQLPEAVIKLKQGFRRLMRTRRDTGTVVILDPRVLTKHYGKTFLDSLPDCRCVRESIEG